MNFNNCHKLNVDSYFQIEKENGNVFDDFNEGEIDFAPTYKYVRTHLMFSRILNFLFSIVFLRENCLFDTINSYEMKWVYISNWSKSYDRNPQKHKKCKKQKKHNTNNKFFTKLKKNGNGNICILCHNF